MIPLETYNLMQTLYSTKLSIIKIEKFTRGEPTKLTVVHKLITNIVQT